MLAHPSGLAGFALDQKQANRNEYVAMKSAMLYVRRYGKENGVVELLGQS